VGKTDLWYNLELAIGLKWYNANHPTALWAERYDKNFENAIVFLKNSEQAALILQKEKERAARNKRRAAIVAIITLALIAIGAFIGIGFVSSAKNEAKRQKIHADSLAIEADTSAAQALRAKEAADSSAAKATRAQLEALDAADRADEARRFALMQKESADIARNDAEHQRNLADTATKEAKVLLKKVAVAQYQKLIREGPTEKSSILKDTFDFKLIAYDSHLKFLGVPRKDDELYEKLYYCLKGINPKYAIKDTDSKLSDSVSIGSTSFIYAKDKKLYLVFSKSGEVTKDSLLFRNAISAIAVDPAAKKLFIATKSKDITILKYDAAYKTTTENEIVLGGVITAIDFYADQKNSIIFFGLQTGETGYINYSNKNERKYQPVYRNDLEWPVTAVDFFKRKTDNRYYLLATNSKGKAVVYESENANGPLQNYLNPDTKLIEVALPDNYGPIKNAKYDEGSDRIVFKTGKFNYKWNPFTEQLLTELKNRLDVKRANLETVIAHTKLY